MAQERDVESRLKKVIVLPDLSIASAIPLLDRAGLGVLLVCDEQRKLIGVITDGDIRRAMMKGWPFDQPCSSIAITQPVVARVDAGREVSSAAPAISTVDALHIMDHARSFLINQLPVVDEQGRVVDLIMRSDLVAETSLDVSAVIMAGGFGKRLQPLTEDLPKPMLLVGDRPLMERLIGQLKQSGIHQVNVTTHYLPDKIIEHFGTGEPWGVKINYVAEDQPLGTAGALSLIPSSGHPLLVINGDILTNLDFRSMLAYHQKHAADMTVAVRRYGLQVPYGVLECEGERILHVREKPRYSFLVNAGVYLLQPSVLAYIPGGRRFDMTDLIDALIQAGRPVISFPIVEYWLDIGQLEDYEQAQKDVEDGRIGS